MKKYIALLLIILRSHLWSQLPTGYCASAAGQTDDEDITNVTLVNINNSTNCISLNGSQGTATGTASLYSDFNNSAVPIPILTPNGTFSISTTITPCDGILFNGAAKVWIDFNRNGNFTDAGETINIGTTTFAFTTTPFTFNNIPFTVPVNLSVGLTKMRVSFRETTLAALTPCDNTAFTWGETEDYVVFLGQKKWDYSMSSMLEPDSISFCAHRPVVIKAKVDNVENQPIPGGRVDLYIKSATPGGTTSLFTNKAFTQTVANGSSIEVEFPQVLFPKDELLEFKYIVTHPLDSNKSNDTLVKYVQVYKNPVYKLKSDTVCGDTLSTVMIYDKPLPLFHKWNNESIVDTTVYRFTQSSRVGIQISRGWKCNVVDSIPVVINPLPKLTMARDTVLCAGQSAQLNVSMDLPGFVRWDANLNSSLPVSAAGNYLATGISSKGCRRVDSTEVKVVYPPVQPKVLDTVCANEVAKIGLDYTGTTFLYKWEGRPETTPLIDVLPTISSGVEKYYVQWWYQGCTSRDTVMVKVNALPNVRLNYPAPICPYFSSTITASGAQTYAWRNGLGVNPSITVSPLTTTDYYVVGTDINGCKKEVMHRQFVYPKPSMTVYSNKKGDNICLGDSATIYVNGGKSYVWSMGATDSVLKIVPTSSFDWTMIGTDGNGCKDTLSYRMHVKPAFSISFAKDYVRCEGDTLTLSASGAKEYDWGDGPTTDAFKEVRVINSTSYQVTATSPYDCQIVASIPVTVLKKPVAQVSDLTICKGETGMLEAKGGVSYDWTILNQGTKITPNGNLGKYVHTDTATIGVEVVNEAKCKDTAYTTVNVINTDNIEVVFKSPLDSYNCASPKIPITLSATPVGGVWSGGSYVTGNKLNTAGLSGTVQVLYTFFESVNNCKVERIKNVKFKCVSSIVGIDGYDDFRVYPMPFTDKFSVKYVSEKSAEANLYIYDLSGREVYHYAHRLLPGENVIDLNPLGLAKGTYYLDFQTESVSRQAKLIAQ